MAAISEIYSVTFYSNGGVFPNNNTIIALDYSPTTYDLISSLVDTPTKEGYVFAGWSNTTNGLVILTMSDNTWSLVDYTALYAVWKVDDSHDKCIFEKGAVDIIVNKIKNIKSGPTISASGDTLTITN